jgi:hypothetical protein
VGARQDADLGDDRADRLGIAPVDARLALEDGAADDLLFDLFESLRRMLPVRLVGKRVANLALAASSRSLRACFSRSA